MRYEEKRFPEIIDKHPSAEIPLSGVISRSIQAEEQQFIFMEFDEDAEVSTHSHNAQWGVVLDGKMELTINGEVKHKHLKKGDSYFIDRANASK